MPRVTVLATAHNDAPFLGAAIDSVLAQTYTDFDLIVVDDASTDGSRAIVESYRDPRIRLIVNPVNLGGGGARNRGLAATASEYVVHLDGNDVCFPDRVARQVRYLDDHPEVAALGAQAKLIDLAGRAIGSMWRPSTDLGIRWCGLFQSPLIQSSVAVRRAVVWDELGGYEERYRFGEDFDLWRRLAKKQVIRNLPDAVVAFRADPMSVSSADRHPARDGYLARKAAMIAESLREDLRSGDISLQSIERWLALGDRDRQNEDAVRDAVELIETCASRFASIHGEDADVIKHQATLLARALPKATSASRPFSMRLWMKIWRRDRETAQQLLPRYAFRFVFGETAVDFLRSMKRRRAQRFRIHASQ